MDTRTTTHFARRVDAGMRVLLRHWLLSANILNGLTLAGAVLVPLLQARGWTVLATLSYLAYRPMCPQRPEHSYFIAGHKMAFEQRETAIYIGLTLGGLLFALVRRRLRPLNWRLLALASLPLLFDVFSQTVGLRESDWQWRTATSLPVALLVVWWMYPLLEREFTGPAAARPARDNHSPEALAREIVAAHPSPIAARPER